MDYPPTTDALRENVRRQMEREAKRQLDRVNKGPGAATDRARRQGARHEGGDMEAGGAQETRMRKATGRMTRNRAAFLMLVVDNDR